MTVTAAPDGDPRSTASRRRKGSALHKIIPLLLVIAGIAVLLYPVVVTYLRNAQQAEIAESYRDSQTVLDDSERQSWLDRAHEYNRLHSGGPILDPWLNRVSKDNAPYQDYLAELNPSGEDGVPMGALSIPVIDSKLPVYHGTETETLHNGVGHLYGSALPVGGEGTHSILTAHTGLTTATLFDRLDEVEVGDAFYLDVMGEILKYEVDQITTVLPEEISDVQPVEGEDLVTLVTCTPYGVNTHRLLVRGTRVPVGPEESQEAFENGAGLWQPWMIGVVIAVAVVLLLVLWLTLRERRKRSATANTPAATEETAEGAGRAD